VLLTWPVLYALMQGTAYAKFIRYTLPLLPFLCLAGAAMWFRVWDGTGRPQALRGPQSAPSTDGQEPFLATEGAPVRSGRASALYMRWIEPHRRAFRCFWLALLAVVIGSTVFYAIAFLNIYRQQHRGCRPPPGFARMCRPAPPS